MEATAPVLHAALDFWAARQPGAAFAAQAGRAMDFAEAREATLRIARALARARPATGQRIAVLARNRLEMVLLYYAASRAGVTLVPLNTRLAPDEWAFIVADCRPRVLFVEGPFMDAIDGLRARLGDAVGDYVALEPRAARRPGWQAFEVWLSGPADWAEHQAPPDPDRDLLQLYTSATTGRPKGAVLTHRAVCANVRQIADGVGILPGERSLVVAPLFHAAVVPSTLVPLAVGGSVYPQAEFRPAEVLRALDQERISFAVLVPAMLQACLASMSDRTATGFETLRLIYYGSSPIAESTLRAAMDAFGCGFVQSYGMTEASQAVTFLTPEDHARGLAGRPELLVSAGRAAADTEIRVVDPLDQPRAVGEPGEVVVRGPQVMRGYWNQAEATAEALRGGWLHTGDIGTLDADGYLTIRDRVKDMIVSGGENVYPRGIEDVLARHPAVLEAAVIGVPDARWGEAVKAVVVPRPGTALSEGQVMAFCRQHLGGFEVPRSVEFVEALPRNAAGKVLRRVLRERYWADQARQVAGA